MKYKLMDSVHSKVEDIYNSDIIDRKDVESCIADLQNLLNEME